MTKTMKKMHRTNAFVRKWLVENQFKDITFFPHTRWIKDVHFQGLDFDGMASLGTQLVLFQTKSNCKPTKKTQIAYRDVAKKYNILCLWINKPDRKPLEVYGL